MASSPAADETRSLDLNAGEQERGSADAVAGPTSDPGRDGNVECLVDSGDGASTPREAEVAKCGDHDTMADVAEEGSVTDNDGVSGAADIGGGLERQEKRKDVEDEGVNSCLADGCEGDQKPEHDVVETGSTVVIAVEAAVAEEVETVPDRLELEELGKSRNEDESIGKFKSSSVEKPNLENDVMAGDFVEGGIAAAEDEATQSCSLSPDVSGGQGKAQMDVMETENVIETAKTMDAVDLDEVKVVEAHFLGNKANVGEKEYSTENESTAVLIEEKSAVNGTMVCDSIDGHPQDKLHVPTSSEMEDGSTCTCKPEVSPVDAECALEYATTLATAAIDRGEVERSVDTLDPLAIQVEVSETSDQTEVEEGHLSYKDGNQIVDGRLQPEEAAVGSLVCVTEKKSCDDEKEEAVFVNTGCPSGGESSMILVGVEAEKLSGVADQGDVEVGIVEIGDKSEPTGEGVSCIDTTSQVTNHEFVDRYLEATEVDLGANALDAGCTMGAVEADPLVALVTEEAESLGGTRDQGRAQVEATEIGNGTELPGHSLCTGGNNQSLLNEVVEHAVADGHLHATKGVLGPEDTDQDKALILESSVLIGETEDVNPCRASVSEMPLVVTSPNIQDEDNAIHQKELQKVDLLLVDATAINQVNNDKRDSDPTDLVIEANILDKDLISIQNAEIGRNSEADQKNLMLGGSIVNVSPDAGTTDDQHMVVDEQETLKGTDKQMVKHVAATPGNSVNDNDQRACYYLPSKDEDGFSTSDLVWGKVKSHPWWPGQIFDPSDASSLALKYQKKDNFLVAYFGDRTFAWCDESQLKHFETYFSQMEKQSNSDVFVDAVDGALDEVSRRMGLGMTCFCFPEAANANINYQKVENAGIREGSNGYTVDRSAILSYFQPGRLLEYVKALAEFPDGETDRLELMIANAQLKAFYRSKGFPELPSFQFIGGLSESDAEIPHSISEGTEEDIEQSGPTLSDLMFGKRKSRGRGNSLNKQKHVSEDGKKQKCLSELVEAEGSQLANGAKTESGIKADVESASFSSSKKRKATDSDSSDSGKGKKKSLDSLGDLHIKLPSPTISSSFKVGECIRRVASQLTGSLPILKSHSETSLKNVSKDDSIFDVFVSDGFSDNNMQSPRCKIENPEEYSSPEEMLSQLCLAASDPMKGYSFIPIIISFFTELRNYCVSSSASEKKHPEKAGGKRGRKRKVDNQSDFSEMMEPDHMQDSYWSDLISHNSPAKSKGEAHTRGQRKKRKSLGQTSSTLTLVPVLQGAEHRQVGILSPSMRQAPSTERPIISVEEKMVDECTPTALILNFNGSKSLPSETDLIRIFSRYGPLKEAATEVQRKNNRVKVVFKKRADAEIAFSSAGKYSIFGPSLLSYRLKYLTSTPDTSPDAKQVDKMDAPLVESRNLDIPGNLHSSMSSASPDTILQDKSDTILTASSNTNIPLDLQPSMSNASPDTNLQDISDAVPTENSNTNIPSNLNPPMSNASLDTTLLDKNETAPMESSNTNLPSDLNPSMYDASPNTNLQDKSDAVLAENSTVPSHLYQSMIDASVDTDPQDKSDAVLIERSDRDLPGNLDPSTCDASPDTNLQDKSDVVLIESNNTNIPSNLHPSTLDASPGTNLQDNVDEVLLESSNTNIPVNLHLSTVDASLDTKPEDKSNTAVVESSNMDISAQAETEIVLDTTQVLSEVVPRAAEVDEQAG